MEINQAIRERTGKVNKYLIGKVNTRVRDKPLGSQWRDRDTVMKWFKNIDNNAI